MDQQRTPRANVRRSVWLYLIILHMKKKIAYLDKNLANKSKLFPSRRLLIKTLQRRKHKWVSLIQQNQELQEENSFLEQKL